MRTRQPIPHGPHLIESGDFDPIEALLGDA
jgi:hypothetical protein